MVFKIELKPQMKKKNWGAYYNLISLKVSGMGFPMLLGLFLTWAVPSFPVPLFHLQFPHGFSLGDIVTAARVNFQTISHLQIIETFSCVAKLRETRHRQKKDPEIEKAH